MIVDYTSTGHNKVLCPREEVMEHVDENFNTPCIYESSSQHYLVSQSDLEMGLAASHEVIIWPHN